VSGALPAAELATFFVVRDECRGRPVSKPKLAITLGKSDDFDRIIAKQAEQEARTAQPPQEQPQPEAVAAA
jgi:hypothetical protein